MSASATEDMEHTDKSNKAELDLANRGNDNTDDNDGDVSESFKTNGGNTKGPGSDKSSDRVGCLYPLVVVDAIEEWQSNLQHLNERDTQVEVDQVTEDQTQAEENADGDDSAPMSVSFIHSEVCRVRTCRRFDSSGPCAGSRAQW